MRAALAAVVLLLLAGPVAAAPGDPRALRGTLEWPASVGSEPFAVVRGDDGRLYYADLTRAQRIGSPLSGRISVVGVEGTQPHEMSAVAVGTGDSALAVLAPTVPTPAEASAAPSSLPRQSLQPAPAQAGPPVVASVPAPHDASAPTEELWQVQGKVLDITPREFVLQTDRGERVRVDVSKLSAWTRDSVRPGDRIKLFGVPQKDNRLVANGFIQGAE
jgi:hypothetical protein